MEEVASDEDVYEVESIIDNVIVGNKMYYLVRWKNYGKDGDTWEPEENLLSCEDLLNNYNRILAEKTPGLSLPSDVFKAGDSGSDAGKPLAHNKETKKKPEKKNRPTGRSKKSKSEKTKTKKSVKSSGSSSESDSYDPPPLKDNFWEKLQEGKIDVFATDLYSKVKSRRPPERDSDTKVTTPQETTGRSKKSGSKKKPEKNDARPSRPTSEEKGQKQPKDKSSTSDKHKGDKEESINSKSKDKKEGEMHNTGIEESISITELDNKNTSPHVVLQYLEGEIQSKSHTIKPEKKAGRVKESIVQSAPNDTAMENDTKEVVLKPDIIVEKIDIEDSPASEGIDIGVVGSDSHTDTDENILSEKIEKPLPIPVFSKEKKIHQPTLDQIKKNIKKTTSSVSSESNKQSISQSEEKSVESIKPRGVFDAMDSFSAHLRKSDAAASERIIQRKVKAKKSKTPRYTPSVPGKSVSGSDKEAEAEKSSNLMRYSNPVTSPRRSSKESKESPELSNLEETNLDCIPEMLEFMKIQVTFQLDEITPKEIERHHEIGEPLCRLDKDITNAEFRQHIRSNNFEIVYEALKSKTMMYNLEHTDSVWMTQLMVAAAAGYDEIVKILAHHGAKVNARTKNGNTALMFAAEKGHDIVCKTLIAYGAYVNLQTTSGETALMKAAKNGFTMIVRYLLQAGSDPIMKSAHGATALELAERSGHSLLSALIKDHESNIIAHINECIQRECHSLGIKTVGLPILAPRSYNIRECSLIHVTFNSVLHNVPPNQGLILFAVHGMIMSGLSIKCRMRGPCHVMAVTMNNFVMEPMMPGKSSSDESTHYMTNLIWKKGQNSVKLLMAQDPLSSEKVFVSIFQCGLVA